MLTSSELRRYAKGLQCRINLGFLAKGVGGLV